jgi:hypothetical protein
VEPQFEMKCDSAQFGRSRKSSAQVQGLLRTGGWAHSTVRRSAGRGRLPRARVLVLVGFLRITCSNAALSSGRLHLALTLASVAMQVLSCWNSLAVCVCVLLVDIGKCSA